MTQARWRALETTQKELSGQLEQTVSVESALKTRTRATVEKLRRDPNSTKATRLMHEDILKRKITKGKKVSLDSVRLSVPYKPLALYVPLLRSSIDL